jgi:hypothetical protein
VGWAGGLIHRGPPTPVARVHRAPAVGKRAARLHPRPRRHPGARPLKPRALQPDGALRGQHRDPQPDCRLAPRASQQLRPLASLREARRVDRAGPRVPAGLCRFSRSCGSIERVEATKLFPPARSCIRNTPGAATSSAAAAPTSTALWVGSRCRSGSHSRLQAEGRAPT